MRYVPALDGLRAIAVLAVIAFHADGGAMLPGGFLGVDLFFVLSGYLITALLAAEHDRTGGIALGRFYLRRLLRLSPALLLLLAGYMAVAPLLWPEASPAAHARDAVIAGFYLADYGYALWSLPLYLRHAWSLAVEEHFYLVWPLVLPLFLGARRPLRAVLALYVAAALWRWANFALLDWQVAYYRFDTRFAGIVAGAALALWRRERTDSAPALPPAAPVAALTLLALLMLTQRWQAPSAWLAGLPLAELASAVLIAGALDHGRGTASRLFTAISMPLPVRLGELSYAIYLWHFPISLLTRGALPWVPSVLLCLAGSTAMAWISWHTVERLGRLAKDRVRVRAPMPA